MNSQKIVALPSPGKYPPIRNVGILGETVLANHLAPHILCSDLNATVVLAVSEESAVKKTFQAVGRKIWRSTKDSRKGRDVTERLKVVGGHNAGDFFKCDLVVETTSLNLSTPWSEWSEPITGIPDRVIQLRSVQGPLPHWRNDLYKRSRVMGVVFTTPTSGEPLVEIVLPNKKTKERGERVCDWTRSLGLTPVVCFQQPLSTFLRAAGLIKMLEYAILSQNSLEVLQKLERSVSSYGFSEGFLKWADDFGLPSAVHLVRESDWYFGDSPFGRRLLEHMVYRGWKGRSWGGGFYEQRKTLGHARLVLRHDLDQLIGELQANFGFQGWSTEIEPRELLKEIGHAAQKAVKAGIVSTPADVETVISRGLGFNREKYGPFLSFGGEG